MNKLSFLLSCLLLAQVPVLAQADQEDLLRWSADRPLQWSDYKGRPDERDRVAASTATKISFEYSTDGKSFRYKIESTFSRTRSWGRHKSDYILQHEQGHFDIAEVYARKLHKALQAYRFDKRNYRSDLSRIYNRIMDEKDAMQDAYDRETNHSIDRDKQAEWLKKITAWLEETRGYADY